MNSSHRVRVLGRELQVKSVATAESVREVEAFVNEKLDEVLQLGRQDVLDNLGGIELTPIRLKCALLGLGVLKAAIYTYKGQKPVVEDEEEG